VPTRWGATPANLRRRVAQKLDLSPDGFLHLRSNNFRAAYEPAYQFRGPRLNRDRKHRIRRLTRQNIEHAHAFFKPTVAPGLNHCRFLFFVKARSNQRSFQVLEQRVYCLIKRRPLVRRLAREVVNQLISNLTAAILEKNYLSSPV